jgi:hypothetical protein
MANEVAALTFSEQRNQGLITDPQAKPPLGAIVCVSAPSVFRALVVGYKQHVLSINILSLIIWSTIEL